MDIYRTRYHRLISSSLTVYSRIAGTILACLLTQSVVAMADKHQAYSVFTALVSNDVSLQQLIDAEKLWQPVEIASRKKQNLGFTENTLWLKLLIPNNAFNVPVAIIKYPLLDEISVFAEQNGEIIQIQSLGDHSPIEQDTIKHRYPVIPLPVSDDLVDIFYLKIRTGGSMQIPLQVMEYDDFTELLANENILFGFYYGYMALLVIVSLIIAVQFKESVFVYYLIYITSFILAMFSMNGYTHQYILTEGNVLASIMPPLFVGFGCLFGSLFAKDFLQSKLMPAYVNFLFHLTMLLSMATIVTSLIGFYPACIKVAVVNGMLFAPTVLVATITTFLNGDTSARYFMLAWGVFLIAMLITGFGLWGFLPSNLFTTNSMQIASMIDVVILSMALLDRAQVLRDQKNIAIEKANTYLKNSNLRLEKLVQQRTAELESKNEKLKEQASLDPLTGILNHKATLERAEEEYSSAVRFEYSISVIMLDIDHFKGINDKHGHPAGDKVLQLVATTLQEFTRKYDIAGRCGGDEFILILSRTDKQQALEFSERLRSEIEKRTCHAAPTCKMTASIGVISEHTPSSMQRLIRMADDALYHAKAKGRNQVVYYESDEQSVFDQN